MIYNIKNNSNVTFKESGYIMKDLAPSIYRQRLVIEGYPLELITDSQIKGYLSELSVVLKMKTLLEPVTHLSGRYGWAGWIHWESSGAHFYAWDQPVVFFSVDIYTCRQFDDNVAVKFTREFFKTKEVVYKGF
jgi:hypothetical protein